MLNKEELLTIRTSLPKDGYKRISDLLGGKSVDSIRMILTVPKRYKPEVIAAAYTVVDECALVVTQQKEKAKNLLRKQS